MQPKNKSSLQIALLGAGQIVQNYHVPALLGLGHHIVFAADPSGSALASLRTRLPEPIASSTDDRPQIPADTDAVLVASPSAFHAAQVRWLLETGHSVFCEKPLACNSEEAAALARLAQAQGRVLQVGYFRRYHPSLQLLGRWLRTGFYGTPQQILVRGGHLAKGIPESFLNPKLSGGGVLMDFGVHVFDMIASWCEEIRVEAYADDDQGAGVEASAYVRLGVRAGVHQLPVTVELSRTSPLGYSVAIDFEKAQVQADLNVGHEVTLTTKNDAGSPIRLSVGEPYGIGYYFAEEWREFASRLNGEPEKKQCLNDAVLATALVEQCYRQKKPLTLPWGD
jgi:predicted dehydrogenase